MRSWAASTWSAEMMAGAVGAADGRGQSTYTARPTTATASAAAAANRCDTASRTGWVSLALVAAISSPDAQKDPKVLEASAAWLRFAEIYRPLLERFLAIIEKGSPGSASS